MGTAEKIWQLFSPEQRRGVIALLGVMLVGTALETVGIGLVIPALALMTQANIGERYPALSPMLDMLGNPSRETLIVAGMMVLVGVYVIKALFLGVLAWMQQKFIYDTQADLSMRLFEGYLRQQYAFHLQRNSAQLIRNTISQINGIVSVIQQGLGLITEALVLIAVSVMLLVVEPLGALLVVSVLGIASWGFNRVSHKHILRWGEALQVHDGKRLQYLQEGLGGVKDAKLLGREQGFLAQYQRHNIGVAKAGRNQATLGALPRLVLELLAISGLSLLVVVMIGGGTPLEMLLPTLGLFAAAAFRLIPSVNRIINAMQGVRFLLPVVDSLHLEFSLIGASPSCQNKPALPLKQALVLKKVSYRYPGASSSALQDISLTVLSGSSVGFIGGSGAGKSTLVDVILGLLPPESGEVVVDGTNIQTSMRGWQDRIGYVPQSIYLTDDTLRRNIAFGLSDDRIDEASVKRAVRAAQLEQFVSELPQGLDTLVGERGVRLSGGQRQRIGIARALYHDPSVLVLDEATSALDMATERSVMDAIYSMRGQKTIIIVAHRLSTVEHCDYLYRLERGVVAEEGRAVEVLSRMSKAIPV